MKFLGTALIAAAVVLLAGGLFLFTASWVIALIVLSWAVIAALAGGGIIYAAKRPAA